MSAVGAGSSISNLTAREKQVIMLVVRGDTNGDIAREFGVSKSAIKHQLANIFGKLRVTNRLELLLFVIHHQLLDSIQAVPQFAGHSVS